MPLQKNVVDLVLAGGQDEKADPRLAVKPLRLVNTRYAYRGSLSKRYGSEAITDVEGLQSNRYFSDPNSRKIYGTATGAVATLVSSRGELLRTSRGALDRVLPKRLQPTRPSIPSSTDPGQLSPIDTLPNHHVEREAFPGTTNQPVHLDAYGTFVGSLLVDANGKAFVEVRDATTLVPLSSKENASVTSGEARLVMMPWNGDLVPAVFFLNASNELRVSPAPTFDFLVASNVAAFDITPAIVDSGSGAGNDTAWLAWTDSAAASNRTKLARVRLAFASAVLGTPIAFGGAAALQDYVAVDAKENGTRVHVATARTSGGTGTVTAWGFNALSTPTSAWGPTTLDSATPGAVRGGLVVKSLGANGDVAVWAWGQASLPYIALRFARTNASGTVTDTYASNDELRGALPCSKAWAGTDDATIYCVAYLTPPTSSTLEASTYAIVRLCPGASSGVAPNGGPTAEWDSYVSPGLAFYPLRAGWNSGVQVVTREATDRTAEGGVATVASFVLPCGTDVDPRVEYRPQALYTASPVSSYGTADAVEDFVFSAGAVMTYDGDRCFEATFPVRPKTLAFDAEISLGGAGGLMAGARYGWRYCYAFRDARGVVHRSAPSDAEYRTFTGAGADDAFTVTLEEEYPYTRRFDGYNEVAQPIYRFEQYRTEANGATFYLESQDASSVTIGTLSDEDLRTQPVLYTTAGALEHACPPPARYAVLALGRVFLLGTEDGNVWPSGTLLQGEAPWWNGLTSFPIPGLGPITGGVEMDLALIVFRENAIYAVTGDGPSDAGDGGFQVQPIATDIGCIDARSIVKVPEGALFLSRDGLAILTRALVVVRVGKGVERFLAGATPEEQVGISAAVNVPTETDVRFSVQRYTDADKVPEAAVCYRLDGMDDPSWSESAWSSHGVSGGMRIVSACLHENLYTWITDNGYVFREATGTFRDGFTADVEPEYVDMTVWLAPWKPGPTQAWMRVWRVGLLGERKDAHDLTVEVFHDYSDTPAQTRAWTGAEVAALAAEQLKVHVVRQKAEAVGVRVTDSAPSDTAVGSGEGLVLAGVALEVGIKPGMHRRPAVQKR